jgi:hypothetical protein
LLSTSISISQYEGRVCVGPGVEKTAGDVGGGVAGAVVTAIVGVGDPVVVTDCVHPADRTSNTQSTSVDVMTRIFFISDNYMREYLMVVSFFGK